MTWVPFMSERFSLLLGADYILLTDGIERAEPLNPNYISIFFVEKDALENGELIRGS